MTTMRIIVTALNFYADLTDDKAAAEEARKIAHSIPYDLNALVEFIEGVQDEGGCECEEDYLCRACEAAGMAVLGAAYTGAPEDLGPDYVEVERDG